MDQWKTNGIKYVIIFTNPDFQEDKKRYKGNHLKIPESPPPVFGMAQIGVFD
jgi:ABC-type sugar transport system substrate-binding protein